MEEWKERELHKAIIPWNSDYTAGRIQEKNENENTICELVSPKLSPEKFKTMCAQQFFNCVSLQNRYNGKRISLNQIILVHISNLHLLKLKDSKLELEMKHKALYNTLLEYDQGKNISTGIITRDDFKTVFEEARRREESCPNDPQTNSFPYSRQDNGHWNTNVWHRAWRMSEAFFRYNKMDVSEKNPDEFKTDLLLWLPVPPPRQSQPADQESSEEELKLPTEEEKIQNASRPPPRTGRTNYKRTKRVLGGSGSSGDDQASVQQPRNDMPAVQDDDGKDEKAPASEEAEEYMSEEDTKDEKKRKAETGGGENPHKRPTVDQFLADSDDDEAGVDLTEEQERDFAYKYGQTLYIAALLHQLKIYAAE